MGTCPLWNCSPTPHYPDSLQNFQPHIRKKHSDQLSMASSSSLQCLAWCKGLPGAARMQPRQRGPLPREGPAPQPSPWPLGIGAPGRRVSTMVFCCPYCHRLNTVEELCFCKCCGCRTVLEGAAPPKPTGWAGNCPEHIAVGFVLAQGAEALRSTVPAGYPAGQEMRIAAKRPEACGKEVHFFPLNPACLRLLQGCKNTSPFHCHCCVAPLGKVLTPPGSSGRNHPDTGCEAEHSWP